MRPDLFTAGELTATELRAAALDGELYAVGPAWASLAVPDLPRLRADALVPALPERPVVVDRQTAAWVWGARSRAPERPTVAVQTSLPIAGLDTRQSPVPPRDRTVLGAVPVTTPLRTAADLLCTPGTLAASDADAIAWFLGTTAVRRDDLRRRLAASWKVPYTRAALRKLAAFR